MGEERNAYTFVAGKLRGRDYSGDLGVCWNWLLDQE